MKQKELNKWNVPRSQRRMILTFGFCLHSLARSWAADDDNDNDDGYSRGKCAYTSPVTKGQKERPKVTQVLDGDQT